MAMNLGADGQMLLRRGSVYSLTSTHLCWQIAEATQEASQKVYPAIKAYLSPSNTLFAYSTQFENDETLFRQSIAINSGYDGNHTTALKLFPPQSNKESSW